MVIMDPDMSLEAGREITKDFLLRLGFKDARFEQKRATSKYYAREQEEEVFANWKDDWLEIGDIGMYSPISLANFNIKYPVFNAGFGIERLTMVRQGYSDIRELVFPQFSSLDYSDERAEDSLVLIDRPQTKRGREIAAAIESAVRKNGNAESPCQFVAYEDDELLVKIVEHEEGKRLVGPAAFNEVYIKEGNILSQLEGGEEKALYSYLEGISNRMAARVEDAVATGRTEDTFRVRAVKSLGDINLQLPRKVKEYMTGEHKKTMVKGPVFLTVSYELK
jgi:O-phosphoseryl-tRNA synthetase